MKTFLEVDANRTEEAKGFLAQYGVEVVDVHRPTPTWSTVSLTVEGPDTIRQSERDVPLDWMEMVNVPPSRPLEWRNKFYPLVAGDTPERVCYVGVQRDLFGRDQKAMPHYYWSDKGLHGNGEGIIAYGPGVDF
jgi:hypothetical protein